MSHCSLSLPFSGSLYDLLILGGVISQPTPFARPVIELRHRTAQHRFALYNLSSKYFVFYHVAINLVYIRTCIENIVYLTEFKRGRGRGVPFNFPERRLLRR